MTSKDIEGHPGLPCTSELYDVSEYIINRMDYHDTSELYDISEYIVNRMDYHDTSELYDISEYKDASPVTDLMCEETLACGIPLYKVRLL